MSDQLWTFDDFLSATGGRLLGARPQSLTGISIDSRTVGPGEAFFAIKGDRFDGHDFVAGALANGATAAVIAADRLADPSRVSGSLIAVEDTLAALVNLGIAARARSKASIAAVTGSVGKTGTKEMLVAALSSESSVHASPASFNNHWGVPLTLARLPVGARFAVVEIGMNHAGEIERLVKMVRPHVAIITTVEPVHLEFFTNVDAIARAKAEIFLGLQPGGAAIINADNSHFAVLAQLARAAGVERVFGFGEHPRADVRLEKVVLQESCSCVSASILGEPVSYKLGVPGRHLVQNSLAVLGAVAVLGGDLARAALALARIGVPQGRGNRYTLGLSDGAPIQLIDESYNANPASMRAAIAVLGHATPAKGGRRIAVLGDMRELGSEGAALHAELAQSLVEAQIDRVFLVGPLMAALRDALPPSRLGGYADQTDELEPILFDAIAPGDVIMVKGSNASRMGPLVEALTARYGRSRAAANHTQGQELA